MMPIKLAYKKTYAIIRTEMAGGVKSNAEYENLMKLNGLCEIEVPYKGVLGILVEEVITPFYLFQVILV